MSVIYNGSRINEPVFSITSTDGVTLTASISGIKSLAELSNKILFYELPVNGGENSTLNINSLGAMPIVKSNGDTTIPAGWVSANQPFGLVFIPADDPVTTGKFVLFGLSSSGGDISTFELSGMQTIEQMPDGNSASKVLTLEQFNSLVESSNINLIKDSTVGGNGIWTYKVLSKMTDTAEASDGVTYEVVGMTYIDNYIDPAEIKTLYFSRNTSDDSLYKGNKLSS